MRAGTARLIVVRQEAPEVTGVAGLRGWFLGLTVLSGMTVGTAVAVRRVLTRTAEMQVAPRTLTVARVLRFAEMQLLARTQAHAGMATRAQAQAQAGMATRAQTRARAGMAERTRARAQAHAGMPARTRVRVHAGMRVRMWVLA
ncbi:hypothetical protein GCM10009804_36230 [Kribbella hippodromi]|uniref:Uncharacterized protein n=1 Tax=Kribbella hippodromi TaxID=434347 RepID=A0ABN2DFS7_9ACTN